jgi:hypothetical protein
MTGTLKTTLIQNPSSADVNITLGTAGEVTLAKSPVLNGSTSGTLTLAAPAVAGTNTQTLVAATGTLAPLISGTAQASTSGTSIDFTSIPSWVKRITVMFNGVSLSGTSSILIQLGDSGGFENTGYVSTSVLSRDGTTPTGLTSTAGFVVVTAIAANTLLGTAVLTLVSGNTWVLSSAYAMSGSTHAGTAGGNKTLSDTLDRVRITTVNGTDTFDAGSINIMYE